MPASPTIVPCETRMSADSDCWYDLCLTGTAVGSSAVKIEFTMEGGCPMADEMTKSPLVEALARAQGAMTNVAFDRTNPHFKSKYASLAAILDVIRKPLADNGLAITQTLGLTRDDEGGAGATFALLTTLRHVGGETVRSVHPLPLGLKPQEFGSQLTYARRYALSALLCISADEDDDANVAQAARLEVADDAGTLDESQVAQVIDLADRTSTKLKDILKFYGASDLNKLRANVFDTIIAKLEAKLEKIQREAEAHEPHESS